MSQENNFIPNQENYKPLSPFKLFVKSNFPFIEATFEALDNYGLYCKIVEYLNTVISNENKVEDNVLALYNAFVNLNNYVSNYFDNLDVQEEINNKLDKMVDDGTLQEIIADYLNSKAIFGYDTVADMKNATNLINGSFAKTLGFYTKNDGGSAIYKIKDSVQANDIYEVLDNGLYAILQVDNLVYYAKTLGLKEGQNNISFNNSIINNILNQENAKIIFPNDLTLYIGTIYIQNNNIEITGGSIFANIVCAGTTYKENLYIHDITLNAYNNLPCISMSYLIRSKIQNCKFKNCNKAIEYQSIDIPQNVSRITIDNNYFYNVNYALYGERPENGEEPLIVADIHFTNNMVEACNIQHLHLEGFDGGIIANNTFFFLSHTLQPQEKTNNIYIDYCNWTIIDSNNIFESGEEAILIKHGQATRITSNNIAWPCQRKQVGAITLEEYDVSGNQPFSISTIANNDIMFSCGRAIILEHVAHININSNNIFGCGSSSAQSFYYGTETYTNIGDAIRVNNTCTDVIITSNNLTQNNIVNSATRAITDNNITLSGSYSNIKSITTSVTINAGNAYGNVALLKAPISIIPLYDTSSIGLSYTWQYHTDNTIQIRVSDTSQTRTFKFKYYYIDNTY